MSSLYYPAISGGKVTIPSSGSLIVDTGLVNLSHAVASLAQDSIAACAGVTCALVPRVAGDLTAKVQLKTWKADGVTAADAATTACWLGFSQ